MKATNSELRKACERLGLNMDNEDNLEFEAEVLALINKQIIGELENLYEQRWIVSLEIGTSKAVVSANDIKSRLIELRTTK